MWLKLSVPLTLGLQMTQAIYNKPKESTLQSRVLSYIKPLKDVWVLNVAGNGVQRSGIPDLLMCVRGLFLAIELKREDGSGRTSGQQRVEGRKIQNAGGIFMVSNNYDEIIELIEHIRKRT